MLQRQNRSQIGRILRGGALHMLPILGRKAIPSKKRLRFRMNPVMTTSDTNFKHSLFLKGCGNQTWKLRHHGIQGAMFHLENRNKEDKEFPHRRKFFNFSVF